MKCQILFAGKNMKNIINLLLAEISQRMIKVKNHILEALCFVASNLGLHWLLKPVCPSTY